MHKSTLTHNSVVIGIDIGNPSKWANGADQPTPLWLALPPYSEFPTVSQAPVATHATLLDEVHSPYRRVNRPLLN